MNTSKHFAYLFDALVKNKDSIFTVHPCYLSIYVYVLSPVEIKRLKTRCLTLKGTKAGGIPAESKESDLF